MKEIEKVSIVLVLTAIDDYLENFHHDVDAQAIRELVKDYINTIVVNEK